MAQRYVPAVDEVRERTQRIAALEETGDLDATPGSRPWAVAVRLKAHAALRDERSKAGHLSRLLDLIKEHQGYRVLSDERGEPFESYEAFCRAEIPFGLGYDVCVINAIIHERKSAEARAANPKYLADDVGPHSDEDKQAIGAYGTNRVMGRGSNSADYLTARIQRDRPDILRRMQAGEFRSVRQAALEAGLVKRTWSAPEDPRALARAIRRRLSDEELDVLLEALESAS